MMKKVSLLFTILLLVFSGISQLKSIEVNNAIEVLNERGELYFRFKLEKPVNQTELSRMISIDKCEGDTIWAYANKSEFEEFLKLNISFQTLPAPSLISKARMINKIDLSSRNVWDFYPTHSAYQDVMQQFANSYPDICRLDTIGQSMESREILVLKISDNVHVEEAEPEFFYTSTMHGDETTGYILMLHLIDYLLNNYGNDQELTELIDETEIWINPLSNPDGTYWAGNSTVNGAIRGNANQIDLNRNFPDPEDGYHPDGNPWQKENVEMMEFMNQHNFVLCANFHDGVEVVNYPWDTWQQLHPDNDWYLFVSEEYVDTVHTYQPTSWSSYFTFMNSGVTNGYEWYTISGGRQDYMNHYKNSREVTIELSNVKTPPAALLPDYWEANYRSIINYLKQAQYGVRGFVTDAQTGNAVRAMIQVLNHDNAESVVYSDSLHGDYYRFLAEGEYDLEFSAPGYQTKIIPDVSVWKHQATILNVSLEAGENGIYERQYSFVKVYPNPASSLVIVEHDDLAFFERLLLYNHCGQLVQDHVLNANSSHFQIDLGNLPDGIYELVLTGSTKYVSARVVKMSSTRKAN